MAFRRSRKTRAVRKRRRVVASRPKRNGGRRFSRGSTRRRTPRRTSNHKKLSSQTVKSFFPDIAKSKLQGHQIWTGIPCNDLSTALAYQQGTTTSNTITIRLNGNPNGGQFYTQPGTDIANTDILNPVDTYKTRYNTYRPMGCKVTVTVFSQDEGNSPDGTGNTQIASPFMLYGFPFYFNAGAALPDWANEWSGQPANGYTADTIPQMKYGFRRISPGLGGKNMVKYSTYWDFAKILGLTREQYLAQASQYVCCSPDDGSADPLAGIFLCLALADYTPAVARQCTVDIKITQYGRWEGQNILFE